MRACLAAFLGCLLSPAPAKPMETAGVCCKSAYVAPWWYYHSSKSDTPASTHGSRQAMYPSKIRHFRACRVLKSSQWLSRVVSAGCACTCRKSNVFNSVANWKFYRYVKCSSYKWYWDFRIMPLVRKVIDCLKTNLLFSLAPSLQKANDARGHDGVCSSVLKRSSGPTALE